MKSDAILHIRIPSETKKAAEKKAATIGLSLSSYVNMLISIDVAKKA